MKPYIGTKTLKARPMTRGEYNEYRGWVTPPDENPADEGYLVEYDDRPPSNQNHPDHAGCISWEPKGLFEGTYRSDDSGLTFGSALEALKSGKRIARKGWNGKGMFLFLLPGGNVPKSAIHDPVLRAVIDDHVLGDTFPALPTIRMWTTNSSGRWAVLTGWLASQTDMLSDDWEIIE